MARTESVTARVTTPVNTGVNYRRFSTAGPFFLYISVATGWASVSVNVNRSRRNSLYYRYGSYKPRRPLKRRFGYRVLFTRWWSGPSFRLNAARRLLEGHARVMGNGKRRCATSERFSRPRATEVVQADSYRNGVPRNSEAGLKSDERGI